MNEFCENDYCDNPGAKVVPVSADTPSDQERTLCTACEEAYTWGVQHGTMVAQATAALAEPGPGAQEIIASYRVGVAAIDLGTFDLKAVVVGL